LICQRSICVFDAGTFSLTIGSIGAVWRDIRTGPLWAFHQTLRIVGREGPELRFRADHTGMALVMLSGDFLGVIWAISGASPLNRQVSSF